MRHRAGSPRWRAGTIAAVVLAGAAVAAGLVYGLPEDWAAWIPAATGAAWTVGLAWLGRRLGRLEGGSPGRSLGWATLACGLLTVLLVLLQVRGRVGVPEIVVLGGVAVAFGCWVVESVRERRRASRDRQRLPGSDPGPWRRGGNGRGPA